MDVKSSISNPGVGKTSPGLQPLVMSDVYSPSHQVSWTVLVSSHRDQTARLWPSPQHSPEAEPQLGHGDGEGRSHPEADNSEFLAVQFKGRIYPLSVLCKLIFMLESGWNWKNLWNSWHFSYHFTPGLLVGWELLVGQLQLQRCIQGGLRAEFLTNS